MNYSDFKVLLNQERMKDLIPISSLPDFRKQLCEWNGMKWNGSTACNKSKEPSL